MWGYKVVEIQKVAAPLLVQAAVAIIVASFIQVPMSACDADFSSGIVINGDGEFIATNGVTGGSGTIADPFLISGWTFESTTLATILIADTRSHFIISGCSFLRESDPASYGIRFVNVSNAGIRNVSIEGYPYGIYLENVNNVTVDSCLFTRVASVHVWASHSVSFSRSKFEDCSVLIQNNPLGDIRFESNVINGYVNIASSAGVSFVDNFVSGNRSVLGDKGLSIHQSCECTITGNRFRSCTMSFWLSFEQFKTISVDSNTVNNLPVIFIRSASDVLLTGQGYGQVIFLNVSDSRIVSYQGPQFEEFPGFGPTGTDIVLAFCTNIRITESRFLDRWCAVRIYNCSGIRIDRCSFTNVSTGVLVGATSNVIVERNEFTNVLQCVNIGSCRLGAIEITDNTFGPSTRTNEGVFIYNTDKVTISENDFECSWMIRFEQAYDVEVYRNNFANTDFNFRDSSGLVFLGNYYADREHEDSNGDGICDVPVVLFNQNGQVFEDPFPLMNPIGAEDGIYATLLFVMIGCMIAVTGLVFALLLGRSKRKKKEAQEVAPDASQDE